MFKSAPKLVRRWSLATETAGDLQYHYKIWSSKFQYEKSKERMFLMPSREEMIEYITETIQEASDLDLEQYFWLMMEQDTNFDSE